METTTLINDVKYTSQVVELTISGEAMYVIICDNNSEGQLNFEIVTPLLKHKPNYDWLRFYHENFIKKSQIKFVGLN
jgi:hypothetical protein